MADNICVNTEFIATAAASIDAANSTINDAFSRLGKAIDRLPGAWNTSAGSSAVTLFYSLKSSNTARSAVLGNYSTTLNQVINPNYTAAEENDTQLADEFL